MKHKYRCLADMEDDIVLLCANARRYNKETSQIYLDSQELEKGFVTARALLEDMEVAGGEDSSEEEEEEEEAGVSISQQLQRSSSSSVHVVEIESYASDNSDGKYYVG